MAEFLVSTADVRGYDGEGNLVLVGKTLLDSTIETTLSSADVRGGRGNQLLYRYFHTAEMNITLSDAQFNLGWLAQTVGSTVDTGNNVFAQEDVTLGGGGAGTVLGTPLAAIGTTIYGWVTLTNGTTEKVTFTGSNFTCSGSSGDKVCVRYFKNDSASQSLTIKAEMIPNLLYVEMEALLCSNDPTQTNGISTRIGVVQIQVPRLQLSGAFTISMTPDGVASTPLSGAALASEETGQGCSNDRFYAKIIKILDNANWYSSGIGALAISGGDFALSHPATRTLLVYAVPNDGRAPFIPPVADLTFASSTVGTATISSAGLVTTVASGTTTLKVSITALPAIDANVILTVS